MVVARGLASTARRSGGPGGCLPSGPQGRAVGAGEIAGRLRDGGCRVGATRLRILEMLVDASHLLSVEEITSGLSGVAQSTVYRTLAMFEERGVVSHTHLGHGPSGYPLGVDAQRLCHLLCQSCGAIRRVPRSAFDPITEAFRSEHGFVPDFGHFAVVGTCAKCLEANGPISHTSGAPLSETSSEPRLASETGALDAHS